MQEQGSEPKKNLYAGILVGKNQFVGAFSSYICKERITACEGFKDLTLGGREVCLEK